MERIDKILSNYAGMSRSDAKAYIKSGKIKINGLQIKDCGEKVLDTDEVSVDGKLLNRIRYRYYMLNKPSGYISSTLPDPDDGTECVTHLLKNEGIKGLFPVGRLDKDTTGLLIITNDGELAHKLTSPKKHVDKTYLAKVDGVLKKEHIEAFRNGFKFKEFTSGPAVLEIKDINEQENSSEALVTIQEGKFHQVKRMFLKIGMNVTELKRLSMGSIGLDESLGAGEYRPLYPYEIEQLKCIF